MRYKTYKNLDFTIKSEGDLRKMTLQRLKKYHRAEQSRLHKQQPWCCDSECYVDWPDDEYKARWKAWELYVGFVCAIYHDRKTKEVSV